MILEISIKETQHQYPKFGHEGGWIYFLNNKTYIVIKQAMKFKLQPNSMNLNFTPFYFSYVPSLLLHVLLL
jgi:hypothetical protein